MTTAYTSLLGLALPVTGELSGTWGDVVNQSITSLLDSAISGTTNVSTDADVTLTTTTGAANTAREAILLFSGARTALRTVTAPAQSKIYTVINATTGGFSVKLVGAGPTTGVTIVAGESAVCAWNGSDFVKVSNAGGSASFTNVTVTGTTTLSGLTASTALALDASKNVVSVTNTGTGNNVLAASPSLTGTVTIATLNLTNALGTGYGGTGLTSFTSGGVLYASSSSALTSGSALTFDGTNFATTGSGTLKNLLLSGGTLPAAGNPSIALRSSDNVVYHQSGSANNIVLLDSAQNTMQSISATANIFNISNSEAMRLTSTGLGIGTSSPSQKLEVAGNMYINTSGNPYLQIKTSGAGNNPSIRMQADTNYWDIQSTFSNTNDDLLFQYNGTALLDLDKNGNLGLGVTPSVWGSPYKAIQVGTTGTFAGRTDGAANQVFLANNYYYNGSGDVFITTGYASRYFQNAGLHRWEVSTASGSAAGAVTFTQAMTLDASGNLGVGTTSPGAKLEVNQAAAAFPGFKITGSNSPGMQIVEATGVTAHFVNDSAGVYVGSSTSYPLILRTNNTERARIDSSGNLLVGTTTPASASQNTIVGASTASNLALAVVHNASTSAVRGILSICPNFSGDDGYLFIGARQGGDRIYIRTSGDVANTNNSYGAISDIKLKENIVDASPKLADLMQVKVRNYNLKSDPDHKQLGVIAQELEQVFPGMVDESIDRNSEGDSLGTTKTVKYSVFVPMLIKAMQEQQAIIESMRTEIDALKAKVGA
jgi:hypothetical protein